MEFVDPLGLSAISELDRLNRKYRAIEKAQSNAAKTRLLPDGRELYYTPEIPARTEGSTRGASYVTAYDSKTGNVRSWYESYDQSGNVNRVHPKMVNGAPVDLPHYPPTQKDIESGKATSSGRAIKCGKT